MCPELYFSFGSELWKWVSKDTVLSELSFIHSSCWHAWSLTMEHEGEEGDTMWRQPGARVSADRDVERLRIQKMLSKPSFMLWVDRTIQKRKKKSCFHLKEKQKEQTNKWTKIPKQAFNLHKWRWSVHSTKKEMWKTHTHLLTSEQFKD